MTMKKLIIKRVKSNISWNDAVFVKLDGGEEYTFEDVGTIDFDDRLDINANKIREENEEIKNSILKIEIENEKLKDENSELKKRSACLSRERRKNEELKKNIEMQDAYITFLRDNIKELKNKLLCYN